MTSYLSTSPKLSELAQGIDVLEESVRSLDAALLDILLCDRTTGANYNMKCNRDEK